MKEGSEVGTDDPGINDKNTTSKLDDRINEEHVFRIVEQKPSFPGGDRELHNFLNKNLRYPGKARDEGVQGRVTVEFVVTKKGEITNVKILKKVHSELDKEAVRVVKSMPNWQPAKHKGVAVDCYYTMPITFRLQ